MFNSVNNPFGQRIESALSTSQDRQQKQEQKKDEEKRYLEEDDNDEVQISQLPELTEDDVIYLTKEYIAKLKDENSDNEKVLQKLDRFLEKFDVKKFMKRNPAMTRAILKSAPFSIRWVAKLWRNICGVTCLGSSIFSTISFITFLTVFV